MDSTRISLARVLELGVQVSWREAAAIVHEAVALTGPTKGARPNRVGPDACVLTRGGEIILVGNAAKARPETLVLLLEHLLPACDSTGGLGAAFERGTVLAFLEELSQRTTGKRRRVEIASVAIRAIAAEAERSMHHRDLDQPEPPPLADFVPPRPVDVTPPFQEPFAPPTPVITAAAAPAVLAPPPTPAAPPAPVLKMVPPPAPAVAPDTSHATVEFDRLRAEMREEVRKPGLTLQAVVDRLRGLDRRAAAMIAVPFVLVIAWFVWPAGTPRLPPRPTQNDPVAFSAIPLAPGWADIDRLGRRVRSTGGASITASAPAASSGAPASVPTAAMVVEPPADAAVALIAPGGGPAAAASGTTPVAVTAVTATPAAAPSAPPTPTPAPDAADDGDAVYSWSSNGVEPPVIRSPAMPSWATPAPGAVIDGPYLEVLVDPQGQVETVRIRGRVDPGETFYRHRMMLASAKLWQFVPARLNGRPVRYVTRVVIEQP